MAPVRLIANWAMTAARTAVSAVSEMVGMTAAAQTGAKTISAPKTSAKETSPTSRTSDEAPLTLSEKNILNIITLSVSACGLFPARLFLQLIDGKEIINEAAERGG